MTSKREIYFSFFMFTADLKPYDQSYTKVLIDYLRKLDDIGYDGVDLHIAAPTYSNFNAEITSYKRMKKEFDDAGFKKMKFTTNVGTTRTYDPTSPYKEQRDQALSYLKSRVEITRALGGNGAIMSGPFLYPYGLYPITDFGDQIWSDALQDWMNHRYNLAHDIFKELSEYATKKGVKLAIEPVKSWETPGPTSVSEVLKFIDSVSPKSTCGVTLDTAQVLMESEGPKVFAENVCHAIKKNRLHYVHISPPDRGALDDSWIPWDVMLRKIAPVYDGPYLVEIFNAIPPFDSSMRMARRRYTLPDEPNPPGSRTAYEVAETALKTLQAMIALYN